MRPQVTRRPCPARGRSAATMVAIALGTLSLGLSVTAPPARAAAQDKPNIVVVTADDLDAASFTPRVMPEAHRLIAGPGTSFGDAVVSGPLCCPSRAAMLTGQYGHNNGVLWNHTDGYGDLRDKANILPVWMRRAGYRTAHVGKYLNEYGGWLGDANRPDHGWTDWHTALEPVSYFNYVLRVNGGAVRYRTDPSHHLTRVLNRTATGLVERHAPRSQPLFMVVDHFAPHSSGYFDRRCGNFPTPDPSDARLFTREPLPRAPSFNERDVSDKPGFVARRRPITSATRASLAREHRCRLASLRGVDRGIRQLHDAFRRAGELDDTVFVFTSDNGWMAGQHRVPNEKVVPYEETLRVPLAVRLPRRLLGAGRPPRVSRAPVANIDIAPTIIELGRALPCRGGGRCRTLDGRSLLQLLRGKPAAWARERAVLLELENALGRARPLSPCDYEGVRAQGRVYVEHHSSTGAAGGACRPRFETELYDLEQDPFQLSNGSALTLGETRGPVETALAERLERLRTCAGVAGRDPLPASGHHCE